jgi:hypothetical protein
MTAASPRERRGKEAQAAESTVIEERAGKVESTVAEERAALAESTVAEERAARLWSVTTLISLGVPKEALIGWAARVTAERAWERATILDAYRQDGDRDAAIKWLTDARWEKTGTAALRGTKVHGIVEAYALGQTPDVPFELEPWHQQIRLFLDQHQPVFEAAEAPVYNLEFGYAGTLDMILRIGDRRVIVDAKTTDKLPDARSRPPYPEVALQLCAYSRAQQVGVSPAVMRTHGGRRYYEYDPALRYELMPPVDGALALVISPVDYQLVPVRIDEEVWRAFLACREVARWQIDTGRRVFGPNITNSKESS